MILKTPKSTLYHKVVDRSTMPLWKKALHQAETCWFSPNGERGGSSLHTDHVIHVFFQPHTLKPRCFSATVLTNQDKDDKTAQGQTGLKLCSFTTSTSVTAGIFRTNKNETHLFRLEICVRKRGGWRYSFFPQCKHDLHCGIRPLRPATPVAKL